MKVLVTVKPVADHNTPASEWMALQKKERANVNFIPNEFDLIAVEQALRLRDSGADDICLVSVTTEEHLPHLRTALAMGADRGIVVDPGQRHLDWHQIAVALKFVVEKEKPDIVLMGKQATDDDACQVASMLAGMLDWPQATFVSRMDVAPAGDQVTVERETDDGIDVLRVTLPAVISCDLRLNEPRYPTLPNLMRSRKIPLEVYQYSQLPVPDEPNVEVDSYELPLGRNGVITYAADADELVAILKERKLID